MNNLTVSTPKLPAHLQHLAGKLTTSSLSSGISAGGHPRISIKGGRFRLQQTNGEELIVPQLHLDVIIVDANDKLSKIYYASKWDSSTPDGEAPDCWSDNGIAPSTGAKTPQHSNCAQCPHNVWGSKINETSGKQSKACGDTKKLAVLIATNPSGPVFELRVPGDSLKNLATYATGLEKHGVPFSTVITRVTFDTDVSHQRLIFNPAYGAEGEMPYINAEMASVIDEIIGTDEVDQCTGKSDKPITGGVVGTQSANPQVYSGNALRAPVQNAAAMPSQVPAAPPSPQPSTPATEPARRTRRTKAEMEAAQQNTVAGKAPEPAAPPFVRNMPPASRAVEVAPLTAPVTNAALDETIRNLMN